MNKEKFNSQDLVEALVASGDFSRTLADNFLKALLATIEEALLQNDIVRINDFGSFKLIWVAARKSVNVQTGKDFVIDGYYKLSFTPDNGLKKTVNQPYAHLETVVLGDDSEKKIDPLLSLSEQANAIKELLSEIEMMPSSQDAIVEQEQAQIASVEKTEAVVIPDAETDASASNQVQDSKTKKKNRLPLYSVLSVVLFLIAFFFVREREKSLPIALEDDRLLNANLISENKAVDLTDSLKTASLLSSSVQESGFAEVNQEGVGETTSSPSASGDSKIESVNENDDFNLIFENRLKNLTVKERVKLENGRYLASLAKEYYGSPHFWVYIYEFNRDLIKNQNSVYPGMEIKLPNLDPRLIDLSNPLALEKAMSLEKTYD